MRTFSSGGVRDDDEDKIDYEGFLSPLALEAFGEYMHKNRVQADGAIRASDNWQKGFGEDHYSVCLKSLLRHTMDLWLEHRGHKARSDKQEALCAIIFNAQAYLHQMLRDENNA